MKDSMSSVTTFDGARYRFEGKCNYVITRDCQTKQFSIHLLNKYRKANAAINGNTFAPVFEGTSLMVKIESTKIHLNHIGKVRINRTLVNLPFIELGQFTIAQFGDRIKLRATKMGKQ